MLILKIKGADTTTRLRSRSLSIKRRADFDNDCSFELLYENLDNIPQIGSRVLVELNRKILFSGVIKSRQVGLLSPKGKVSVQIFSQGNNDVVSRRYINEEPDGISAGQFIRNIINDLLIEEGISQGTIEEGIILKKYDAKYKTVLSVLNDLSGACDFTWFIDDSKRLHLLRAVPMPEAPFEISDMGVFKDFRDIEVEEAMEDYYNTQLVKGSDRVVGASDIDEIERMAEVSGGSGRYENLYENDALEGQEDTEHLAYELIARKGSFIPVKLKFKTYTYGFEPGQKLKVNLSKLGISGYYLIGEVNIKEASLGLSYNISCNKLNSDGTTRADERWTDYFGNIHEEIEEAKRKTSINSIVEVTKETVITAETAHILNAWIKNLYVDYLETNFSAIDPRLTAPTNSTRDYIRVKDLNMDFITQELSDSETEELMIPNPSNLDELINVYYTAIGDHPDAYKYFTITRPKNIYPELTDEEENAFKVMVRKRGSSGTKMKICFDEITLSNGTKTIAPVMIWGAGDGTTGNKHPEIENEERCARGFIYKDQDGLKIQYFKSNTGELREVKLSDEGVVITPPITEEGGGTGGSGGSFYVSTREPIESDGEEGDVWFVVPNSGNDILSFVLPEQTKEAVIDNENNTVEIEVATGTNLSGLTPTITISEGATIVPESGTAQNFSNPFNYIVTAEDGTPKTWIINVSVKASSLDTYPNTAISEHINDISNLLSTTCGFAAATGDVIGLEITFCANNLKAYYDEFGGEYLDNVSFILTFMNDDTGNILTYQVRLEASQNGANGVFVDDTTGTGNGSYFYTRKASTASCALTQQRVEGVVPSEFDGVYGWVSLDVDCMISQYFAPPNGAIWIYGYKILRNGVVVSQNDFGTTSANPSPISEGHQKIPYQLTPWERYGMSAPTGGV